MVIGVARGVEKAQDPPAEVDLGPVLQGQDPPLGDRHQVAEGGGELGLAVDLRGPGGEPGGVDHVARPLRVDGERRPRALLHQGAGAAGVVEVDMGRNDVVHLVRRMAQGGEGGHQQRDRV